MQASAEHTALDRFYLPRHTLEAGVQFMDEVGKDFEGFTQEFADLFRSGRHNVVQVAHQYIRGLMQAEKRNMGRMTEAVPGVDYQVLQNFLTHSGWAFRPVMERVALKTSELMEGPAGTGLWIDESCFAKKGNLSVGVASQWNGRLGKEENSQVGVFAALGKNDRVGIIDARLYLPKKWTDDPDRCAAAGVPILDRTHRTKIELAGQIIRHAREIGVQFEWVGYDSGYGHSLEFLENVQNMEEVFLADIHSNRHIYLTDPKPFLPPQGPGRKRVHHESKAVSTEVRKWVKQQPESRWRKVTVRESTKGDLVVDALHERVWLWDKESPTAHCWHLIVRRELESPDTIKYSLSNAPERTSVTKLAQMQGQRYWIERAFQDAKSHIGMAQYQARGWDSWHRHMALVMMASNFMLRTRLKNADVYPLLSCYDIQVLLAKTLPDRRANPEELFKQMLFRHKQRQESIDSASS
jgi:SRSO17 transposase